MLTFVRRHLKPAVRRAVAWCLLVAVPVYAVSGTLVQLLGVRHVLSTRANKAESGKRHEHVVALSERTLPTEELTPGEWLRLAILMLGPCFATRPAMAPLLPLAAPMPNRSARPIVQHIQHFTVAAKLQAGKKRAGPRVQGGFALGAVAAAPACVCGGHASRPQAGR
jgi:hypothetical protein